MKRDYFISAAIVLFLNLTACRSSDTDQSLQTSEVALINVNLIGTDYTSIDYRRYISTSISQSK
ncbi:hypothetical protein [Elizabethkingia anophelis]|uniref:hypothetical protein n=1 Tax=Elizabethkingia anophelis TaxID=1117645 RepID=UPI002936D5AC